MSRKGKLKIIMNKIFLKYNPKHKSPFVYQMFESLSAKYDLMNNLITLGLHKYIKKHAIKKIPIQENSKILDICTGTGDIALELAKNSSQETFITAVDFSPKMLDIAGQKAGTYNNINFIQANALNLPFADDSFDISIISFGLRNLDDINQALQEFKRVTKKDGYIVNIDIGKPSGILAPFIRLYFTYIVPFLGKFFGKNNFYYYLPLSATSFPSQEKLLLIYKGLDFKEVKNYNYLSGIIAQQIIRV